MSALKFADLLTEVSVDLWKKRITSVANAVGLKTEDWSKGGYTRTLVALFSQLYKTAGDVVRIIASSGFLDTAEGDWLTFLAKNLFGVERIEATFAAAPKALVLTNTSGLYFEFDPGDVLARHVVTQRTYRATSGGTLRSGAGQTLTLDLRAEESGSASDAAVGTISSLVSTFLGVTCTNTTALVGVDREDDASLRDRCRDSIAALAIGGTKRSYEFAARSAKRADGTPLGVTRVLVMPAVGDGTLDVYVAGPSGAISDPDLELVQAAFDSAVTPEGFEATAISANNLEVSVPCTIWIPASLGLTGPQARQAVFDALEKYVRALPIGGVVIPPASGKIYWRALLAIASGAIPGTLRAQLTSESDINVATGQVPVWDGDLTDTTIEQV